MKSIRAWLEARWNAFKTSYDPEDILTSSDPRGLGITVGSMLLLLSLFGYVPPLSDFSEMRHVWVSLTLTVVGGCLTVIAYRTRLQGFGQVATLLDNSCYSAALLWAATHSSESFGVGMAAVHAVALTMFQARFYGLTLLGSLVLNLPAGIAIVAFDAPISVRLILVGTVVIVTLMQHMTRQRLRRRPVSLQMTLAEGAELNPSEQAQALVGTVLGNRWTLEKPLGLGGMGAVFEARGKDGARVAIKLLHRHVAGQVAALRRLRREARLANSIDHPNVVKIHECEVDEVGSPYLVMELLEGESLQQKLERERRLPAATVERLATNLLDIMVTAHAQNILHRDLKPSNLFLTKNGTLKVLDFGLARGLATEETLAHVSTITGSLTLLGTPGYMSPEMARGRSELVDARTDIWALGATLFALLTGRTVHEADTVNELLGKAMTTSAPSVRSIVADLPERLARVVDKSLSYDMNDRYPSIAAMNRDLAGQTPATHPTESDQTPSTGRLGSVG